MFQEILRGQYERWRGLTRLPTLEELAESLAPSSVHSPSQRNRIATRYSVIRIERTVPPTNLEAWIPIGTRTVTILEVEDPVCLDIESTLDAMGKPEIFLEDERLHASYLVSEWVFAQRGIVLSIGKPLPSTKPPARRLLHARLFAPMSLQSYLTEVGEANPALPNPIP